MNNFYITDFRTYWNNSLNQKPLRFVIFIFCLLSCHKITYGKEARIQRRFMWKQTHMENLVSDMATRAYAIKNALSDLVPTIHSAMPHKDFFPSETTRVKYIIRNPTTNQPIKIIKMRPTKKIIKIVNKSPVGSESKPILLHKQTKPSTDQTKKIEMVQELITEGRSSFKSGNEVINQILDGEKYTEHTQREIDKNNPWFPVADTSQTFSLSSIRPNAITSLHTSIMAEPLQSPEKQVPNKLVLAVNDNKNGENDDSPPQQKYYDNTMHTNSYEVTENIAEESIALPLVRDYQISLRSGTASNRFSPTQITNQQSMNIGNNVAPTSGSSSSDDPPNYSTKFLRRFRERPKLSTTLPSITSTLLTPRTQKQRKTVDVNALWAPNAHNITNHWETLSLRTRFQGMQSHTENEKWAVNAPDRISTSEGLPETKSVVISSTTAAGPQVAESVVPSAGSLKKKNVMHTKVSQNDDIRVHNRGRIKFGDKIFVE